MQFTVYAVGFVTSYFHNLMSLKVNIMCIKSAIYQSIESHFDSNYGLRKIIASKRMAY